MDDGAVELFKENMGPNLKAIKPVAWSVIALHVFTCTLQEQTHVPPTSSAHLTKSDEEDMTQVVSVLLILEERSGRKHSKLDVNHLDWVKNL